ncbi:Uncharacterised protein [Candidatus Tiddalikarchaeum anstoanum]|nr:Uncharacterised protein [Candidatus Tiddalikarchaeum anstoanum]
MKKTQFFSFEIVSALLIFTALFLFVLLIWSVKESDYKKNLLLTSLEKSSMSVGELLATTPGSPNNWSTTYIEQLGLADNYNTLNPIKLENFFYLTQNNYSLVKELLGISSYDFFVQLEDFNNNVLRKSGNFSGYSQVVIWQENVLLNNSVFRLKVGVTI